MRQRRRRIISVTDLARAQATGLSSRSIRPNPGPQEAFISTAADMAIFGGSRGSGKTFALLLDPLRHVNIRGFTGAIVRRTYPQIREVGGLWEASHELYPAQQAESRELNLAWRFRSGAAIRFAHLDSDKDLRNWMGAQVCYLAFDQLEQFTAHQYWMLMGANRSTCGIRPYCRATCNPMPDSWLSRLLSWWIDQETGYPIPERSGVLRWLRRLDDDTFRWYDSAVPGTRSLTFIGALPADNPVLMQRDPEYIARLENLTRVERERYLHGNWLVREAAGEIFRRDDFVIVDHAPQTTPNDITRTVRAWDKAATHRAGKWTAGVKMSRLMRETGESIYLVEDVVRGQWSAFEREQILMQSADGDGEAVDVILEQEPGSGGKEIVQATASRLSMYRVIVSQPRGAKTDRTRAYAAQAQARNVYVLQRAWTEDFLREHENFGTAANRGVTVCDQVDAAAMAYNELASREPLILL